MTTTPHTADDVRRLLTAIRANFAMPDMIMQLMRLLADGEPVTVQQIAAAGGWPTDHVQAELDRHPGTDWNDDGRVAGFGLTLHPTPHTFTFDGRTVYAYCASDALAFPIVLGRPGIAESTCPATGRTIRVELTPTGVTAVQPATAVISKVRPAEAVTNVRTEICDLGNFFAAPEAAADWLTRNPHGQVVTVTDDFDINKQALTQLGWAAAPQAH